jgi:hypothetical protein
MVRCIFMIYFHISHLNAFAVSFRHDTASQQHTQCHDSTRASALNNSPTDAEPPWKRARLARGVHGRHAANVSLVAPENVHLHKCWRVTSLGRLIRPIRMRPARRSHHDRRGPLPSPLASIPGPSVLDRGPATCPSARPSTLRAPACTESTKRALNVFVSWLSCMLAHSITTCAYMGTGYSPTHVAPTVIPARARACMAVTKYAPRVLISWPPCMRCQLSHLHVATAACLHPSTSCMRPSIRACTSARRPRNEHARCSFRGRRAYFVGSCDCMPPTMTTTTTCSSKKNGPTDSRAVPTQCGRT